MIKKQTISSLIFLLFLLLVILIFTINGNEDYRSYASYALGPAIGFIIGSFVRERKKIINIKKFRTDLIVLLSCALIGSFLIAIILKEDSLKVTYVISLNIVLLAILALRNANNFKSKK